jgi:citrate lyase subunit beta/citryl-CoA lyase
VNLLRSVLYVPAHREELIAKAPSAGADAVCLVLEDSVPDARKAEARAIAADAVPRLAAGGTTVLVKLNGMGDAERTGAELDAVVGVGLAGVIVPGLERPSEVERLDSRLADAEGRAGIATGAVAALILIETPLAAHQAFALAATVPRTAALLAGTAPGGDMARELGFQWTQEGLERLYFRSKVLLEARAAGLAHVLDGVYGDVRNLEGLEAEARFARQLGYTGKLVVHPSHVGPVNAAFTPSAEEVDRERRVLEAFDAAVADGRAGVVVEGRFVDYAMAATARRIVALAEAAAERDR